MPDLCKLVDVKAWLSIDTSNNKADAMLTRLITAVSRDFLTAIDRHDLSPITNYTEIATVDQRSALDSSPYAQDMAIFSASSPVDPRRRIQNLALRHWPIQSIDAVTINGIKIAQSDGTAAGWFYDENEEAEYRNVLQIIGWVASWTSANGVTTAVVDYEAGYDTTPEDIEQAVIEWVAYRYRMRDSIGQVNKRLSTGESVQYDGADAPQSTKTVIANYTRSESLL